VKRTCCADEEEEGEGVEPESHDASAGGRGGLWLGLMKIVSLFVVAQLTCR
jgi:hypothetical protein